MLGRDFPTYRVFLIVFSLLIIVVLWFGVERTRWGAMVRAAVDNRAMAQSIGINTRLLFMATFALGSGLAGLGGALGADILPVQWSYPVRAPGVLPDRGRASAASAACAARSSPRSSSASPIPRASTGCPSSARSSIYAATIGVLLWRPQGLFGTPRHDATIS